MDFGALNQWYIWEIERNNDKIIFKRDGIVVQIVAGVAADWRLPIVLFAEHWQHETILEVEWIEVLSREGAREGVK
jgi:hypothetical protein